MICRVHKESNYTVICNKLLKDKRLTLKAIGLMCKVLSLPDDWNYSVAGLTTICRENRSAIDAALKELQEYGYLVVTKYLPGSVDVDRVRTKIEYEYNFYEQPYENQPLENQAVENLVVENQQQLNKEITNKEEPNKDNIYTPEGNSSTTEKPRRNYTTKPIRPVVSDDKKKLTRQEKKEEKISELLNIVPKEYRGNFNFMNTLGDYLDMRIGLSSLESKLPRVDREWFEKEWNENIEPALEKYSVSDVINCIRTVTIPRQYKRCFISVNTYPNKQSTFDNVKGYTEEELAKAEEEGSRIVEQAKKDGTYQREF